MVGGVLISSICCLEFVNLVNSVFAEHVYFSEELVEGLVHGIKSSEISVSKSLLELLKESFACTPCLLEFDGESICKSSSDVIDDLTEFRASGGKSSDELRSARWKFAKEEFNGGLDLLLELFVTDSVSIIRSIASGERLVDLSLNLVTVDITINFGVLWSLRVDWSGVLVLWDMSVIRLFGINEWAWLDSLSLGNRWLS